MTPFRVSSTVLPFGDFFVFCLGRIRMLVGLYCTCMSSCSWESFSDNYLHCSHQVKPCCGVGNSLLFHGIVVTCLSCVASMRDRNVSNYCILNLTGLFYHYTDIQGSLVQSFWFITAEISKSVFWGAVGGLAIAASSFSKYDDLYRPTVNQGLHNHNTKYLALVRLKLCSWHPVSVM